MFFNLETGKKIKRRQFTSCLMLDLVIAKVKKFARQGVVPGAFDFAGRSRILFEWNDKLDKLPTKGLITEDVVLYRTKEIPRSDAGPEHRRGNS